MLPFLPFFLLAIPLAEIAVFVLVGSHIGVLPTIGLVILTAIAGATLLRIQGLGILVRIRAEAEAGRVPGRELVHAFMIMAAGLLLLLPGLITDTLGILLFIPAVRDFVWTRIARRVVVVSSGRGFRTPPENPAPRRGRTIDLDETDYSRQPNPDSPWRHEPGQPRLNGDS